jgi:formate dehydrogenase subunit delta
MNANKLVRMANQIAANFAYDDEVRAAAGVADHLRRFWTPEMCKEIVRYYNENGAGLERVAEAAVSTLANEAADAA